MPDHGFPRDLPQKLCILQEFRAVGDTGHTADLPGVGFGGPEGVFTGLAEVDMPQAGERIF